MEIDKSIVFKGFLLYVNIKLLTGLTVFSKVKLYLKHKNSFHTLFAEI